eukprot:comp21596_c0_seq4/m.30234 comp21596_c0_seq4/g.30234  ORF comp21596_c0_seq4/g.30234 comp21596_c0_seq4/m.30234 type:complete len:212 (-) comp21596_c0_seq4:493-1128(-)
MSSFSSAPRVPSRTYLSHSGSSYESMSKSASPVPGSPACDKGMSPCSMEKLNHMVGELSSLQHTFESTTFVKPTYCRNCDKLLVKGVRCVVCKSCFHHKGCGQGYPSIGLCPVELEQNDKFLRQETAATLVDMGLVQARQLIPYQPIFRQIPFEPREHNFLSHTYTSPTGCAVCGDMLKGIYKQGLQCVDCCYNVHESCRKKVLNYCSKKD